jgi:hypothetical protein
MPKQQPASRKESPSKREAQERAEGGQGEDGHEEEVARYEDDLVGYLQERIKPGLSSSAIPLVARSIAKEIAHREDANGGAGDADGTGTESAGSETPLDFEADMRELQAELGEDWILRFSVQGDDGWLTAEKDDGSQRVEAPAASVLAEAVELLNEGGGRSG